MSAPQVLKGIRVLVVDDFPDAASTLELFLRMKGASAVIALTGESAIAIAADFKPHAVLLDIDLPDISGVKVCAALRRMQWSHTVCIVAVSGWEFVRLCDQQAGFDLSIPKPSDPERLTETLAAWARDHGLAEGRTVELAA